MADDRPKLAGDLIAGNYAATGTVWSGRRNLFYLARGRERMICTLLSGSKTGIQQFDEDCLAIVQGLSALDSDIAAALREVREHFIVEYSNDRRIQSVGYASDALPKIIARLDAALAALEFKVND